MAVAVIIQPLLSFENKRRISLYPVILSYHFEYFFVQYGFIKKMNIIYILIINPMPA